MIFAPLMKYALAGMAFVTLIMGLALTMERRHSRKLSERNTELTELRKSDRASYAAAQAQAKANNEAQIHKIEAQNEAITNRVRSDYSRDLERLRALAKANRGVAGGTKTPGVPGAPGGVDGTDQVRFPASDLLRAQEIELQLKYLIDWLNQQAGVR